MPDTPRYDDHEFYEDPEPRQAGRCDYTYPDGQSCGEDEQFHWHEKVLPQNPWLATSDIEADEESYDA